MEQVQDLVRVSSFIVLLGCVGSWFPTSLGRCRSIKSINVQTQSLCFISASLSFSLPGTLQQILQLTPDPLANNIPDQLLSATKIISACCWNAATSELAVISNLIMLIDSKYWHFPHINILTFPSKRGFEVPLWGSTSKQGREYTKRVEYRGRSFSHPKHRNIPLGSAVHVCLYTKNVNALPCITLQYVLRHLFT